MTNSLNQVTIAGRRSSIIEESKTEAHMSLYALTSSKGDGTLKVQGILKDKEINILVDSGFTHNFVSQNLVKQLQLRTEPCSTFQVIVANGDNILCSNIINVVQWTMAGEIFTAMTNVIPLGGYDLILGASWMSMVPMRLLL